MKVSVVMPVYNEGKYLDKSISSILNQTFKDFELIIVNDKSTDNSLKIIKSYKDKRIKLVNLKKNVGFPQSRNEGLKIAKGEYIALLDGDDISHPSRLRIQTDYLDRHKHIFLVGTSAVYIDENGDEIRRFRKYDNYRMIAWRLLDSCCIVCSSVMFRNSMLTTGLLKRQIKENLFYANEYGGASDYHFYLERLAEGKMLTNIPQFLTYYRLAETSMSVSNKDEQERLANKTKEEHQWLKNGYYKIENLYYLFKSFLFYLRTYQEKKIKKEEKFNPNKCECLHSNFCEECYKETYKNKMKELIRRKKVGKK